MRLKGNPSGANENASPRPQAASTPYDGIASQNFLLLVDDKGEAWVFPRAHLVAAVLEAQDRCGFNFRTHWVKLDGGDTPEVFEGIMSGKLCKVFSHKADPRPGDALTAHVQRVEVLSMDPAFNTTKAAGSGNNENQDDDGSGAVDDDVPF